MDKKAKIVRFPSRSPKQVPLDAYDEAEMMQADVEYEMRQEAIRDYVYDYKSPKQFEREKLIKVYPWLGDRLRMTALSDIQELNEYMCFKLISILHRFCAGKNDIGFCEFCKIVEFLQPEVAKEYA